MLCNNPEDWRKIYKIVSKNYQENDLVLFDAGYLYYPFAFYNKDIPKDKCIQLKPNVMDYSKLSFLDSNRIWLILGHNWDRKNEYRNLISKK